MNTSQAARHFGSKKKLAAALGVTPSAVTLWGEAIPLLRQFQIQMLTEGALKACAELRPTSNKSCSSFDPESSGLDGSVYTPSSQQAAL